MAIPIRSAAEIANKWQEVTPQRSPEYEKGVKAPASDWKTNTAAAASRHTEATQKALSEQRFAKGVAKSSTQKWQEGAVMKGVRRFAEGVAISGPAFETGFAPYRDAIANATLPARYPAGDPRNIERVKVLADILHRKKIA